VHLGLLIPPIGPLSDPGLLVDLAAEADQARWDGFFLYDHIVREPPIGVADPWVVLAAVATATDYLRLGPLVTPLVRRRPWVVAHHVVTLDRLSRGRAILGVGLGSDRWRDFAAFDEPMDLATRGRMLDEGLEIITRLWSGTPVNYQGRYYSVRQACLRPRPIQSPRVPIWVGGQWPNRAPLRRAARYDGMFPTGGDHPLNVDDFQQLLRVARATRKNSHADFDLVARGRYGPQWSSQAKETLSALEEVGVTWWLEVVREVEEVSTIRTLIRHRPEL
jgi:alkanesulfonate monooxygenase SsuD/methylene tetrahydromethanopterin reductase-like flavin-dependent oxidoreductase (luciferase family)